jgi:hypothetical protein
MVEGYGEGRGKGELWEFWEYSMGLGACMVAVMGVVADS